LLTIVYIKITNNKLFHNRYYFNVDNIFAKENLTLNLSKINSYHSHKFNIIKYHYYIQPFDKKFNKILPSNLTSHNNFHLICLIIISNKINIYSLPKIVDDKYFQCVEYSTLKENVKLGVILYKTNKTNNSGYISQDYSTIYLNQNLFNNRSKEDDDIFDPSKISKQFNNLLKYINDSDCSLDSKKLKGLYILKPIFLLKRNSYNINKKWNFLIL
jgi:hypothetical protein